MGMYILNDKREPIRCDDLIEWGRWFEQNKAGARRVDFTKVGDSEVSTVFLGMDHSFGAGQPVLWETMIFGGAHDSYQERYTSHAAAVAGHQRAVVLANEVATNTRTDADVEDDGRAILEGAGE